MARPRKTVSPLELEVKDFLEKNKPTEKVLTTRDYVAMTFLVGLLSRSSGLINVERLRELKKHSYEYAEEFLKD